MGLGACWTLGLLFPPYLLVLRTRIPQEGHAMRARFPAYQSHRWIRQRLSHPSPPDSSAPERTNVRIVLLGAATGLRSLAAPSQLSRHLRRERSAANGADGWIGAPTVHRLLQLAAIGEMIVDKLPMTPDRIAPGPLAGRAVLGSAGGAEAGKMAGTSALRGALLGAVGAVLGAYAGYHARRRLVRSTGLPDFAVALCEDVVAIALARGALARPRTASARAGATRRRRG